MKANVDWVTQGAVTSVKNQGSSGTVVPYVAAGALEAITKIRDGTLKDLPEKSLEDCAGQNSFWGYFEYARTKGTILLIKASIILTSPNNAEALLKLLVPIT